MSEQYFAHPGVSNSAMKQIARSPKHFIQWIKDLPEASKQPAMRVGTALHHRILDEGKPDRIKIFDTTVTFNSKAGEKFLAENHPHNICLTVEEWQTVQGMEASIRSEEKIMRLIRGSKTEVEIYGEEQTASGKIPAKAMIDCLGPTYILDLKTTMDEAIRFRWEIKKRYLIQGPWYQHMALNHYDGVLRDFYFVVVEKKPPYGVRMFKVSEATLAEGEQVWRSAIETYAKCLADGVWPGYNNDLIEEV